MYASTGAQAPGSASSADLQQIAEAQTTAILAAVEQQLTRYFSAMAARADAVQQAGEAGRNELIVHFQQQIDALRGEAAQSHQATETYERALQQAIEERLTEFASNQQWRFGEMESRLERVNEELRLGSPAQVENAIAPIQERFDRTTEVLATRIEELQKAARRFDEQSAVVVQHVNDTTATLSRRLDETSHTFATHLDERTVALSQRVDDAAGGMRQYVSDQLSTVTRRIDESDNRTVDKMLAMEERINEQTGVRMAAVEATIGRISTGIDEAIVALSHRVIELENDHLAMFTKLEEMAAIVAKVDEDGINQLREQMSSAVGESMLVRIELERVASSTGEQFDHINVRMAELAAQIAENDLDVSTAVQLERLEEIERALSELNPDQFVRKPDNGGLPNLAAPAANTRADGPNVSDAESPESNVSAW